MENKRADKGASDSKIRPLDVDRELPSPKEENLEEAERLEATDSGIVDPKKNEILEQHMREHPEGDPAVRRIRPDRGEIPIEERHDDGTMTVDGRPRKKAV